MYAPTRRQIAPHYFIYESHYSCGPIMIHCFDSIMAQINLRVQHVLVKLNIKHRISLSEVRHVFYSPP
jgi:hypothetical protein